MFLCVFFFNVVNMSQFRMLLLLSPLLSVDKGRPLSVSVNNGIFQMCTTKGALQYCCEFSI